MPQDNNSKACKGPSTFSFSEGSLLGPSHPAAGAVLVRVPGGSTEWCSGILLCNKSVLTAAHCFVPMSEPGAKAWFISERDVRSVWEKARQETKTLSPNDPTQFFPCKHANGFCSEIKSYSAHPNWPAGSKTSHPNDIAVAELADSSPLRNFPKLATSQPVKDTVYLGIGWGNRSFDLGTKYGEENFLPQKLYNVLVDGLLEFKDMDYVEGVLWDEGKGSLPGDSGGPLLGDSALQGKDSAQIYAASGFKWSDPKIYAVASGTFGQIIGIYRQRYVPVSKHIKFIQDQMAKFCSEEEECKDDDNKADGPKPTSTVEPSPTNSPPNDDNNYVNTKVAYVSGAHGGKFRTIPVPGYFTLEKYGCNEYLGAKKTTTTINLPGMEPQVYVTFAWPDIEELQENKTCSQIIPSSARILGICNLNKFGDAFSSGKEIYYYGKLLAYDGREITRQEDIDQHVELF